MGWSIDVVEFMRRRRGIAMAPALAAALAAGGLGSAAVAQDGATPDAGSPPRPAHIHEGSCDEGELGGIVVPLTDLTGAAPADGGALGNAEATVAESSYTNVPLTLDAILSVDHAINVHLSAEEIGEYIACGEIGGALNANGALVIGLQELNRSGFTGIAFLAPGADGASTDVSVFVAEGLAEQGRGGQAARQDSPGEGELTGDEEPATEGTDETDGMATAAADIEDIVDEEGTDAPATEDSLLDEEGALSTEEIDATPSIDEVLTDETATDGADEGEGFDADGTQEIDIDGTTEEDDDEA